MGGVVVGAFGLPHGGDTQPLGQLLHGLLTNIGQRTNESQLAAEQFLVGLHRADLAAVKLIENDSLGDVIDVMSEGDLVETLALTELEQGFASVARPPVTIDFIIPLILKPIDAFQEAGKLLFPEIGNQSRRIEVGKPEVDMHRDEFKFYGTNPQPVAQHMQQ